MYSITQPLTRTVNSHTDISDADREQKPRPRSSISTRTTIRRYTKRTNNYILRVDPIEHSDSEPICPQTNTAAYELHIEQQVDCIQRRMMDLSKELNELQTQVDVCKKQMNDLFGFIQ